MQNKLFLKAADICELLEVKQTSAYEIIGNLNKELEEPYLAGGRRLEICWSMGTKAFAVFERIPQDCISGSDDEWQSEGDCE